MVRLLRNTCYVKDEIRTREGGRADWLDTSPAHWPPGANGFARAGTRRVSVVSIPPHTDNSEERGGVFLFTLRKAGTSGTCLARPKSCLRWRTQAKFGRCHSGQTCRSGGIRLRRNFTGNRADSQGQSSGSEWGYPLQIQQFKMLIIKGIAGTVQARTRAGIAAASSLFAAAMWRVRCAWA